MKQINIPEVWKDTEYEFYQVSNLGRVKSLKFGKERILQAGTHVHGYKFYCLYTGTGRKVVTAHSLVCAAFIGPRPEGKIILHKNNKPHVNTIFNLSYGTPRDNWLDSVKAGTAFIGIQNVGVANQHAKLTEADVERIRELYATGNFIQAELGAMFNVSGPAISKIVNRKVWAHVGAA